MQQEKKKKEVSLKLLQPSLNLSSISSIFQESANKQSWKKKGISDSSM